MKRPHFQLGLHRDLNCSLVTEPDRLALQKAHMVVPVPGQLLAVDSLRMILTGISFEDHLAVDLSLIDHKSHQMAKLLPMSQQPIQDRPQLARKTTTIQFLTMGPSRLGSPKQWIHSPCLKNQKIP